MTTPEQYAIWHAHIRRVRLGERIQDLIADRDGFVWFDEVGLLGAFRVYETAEAALAALHEYASKL